MNKSLSYRLAYVVIFIAAYHLAKIITQRFVERRNQAEYDSAWEVILLDRDTSPTSMAALRSAVYTNFEYTDDGRLFVVDYSSGNPRWKQVGMDE